MGRQLQVILHAKGRLLAMRERPDESPGNMGSIPIERAIYHLLSPYSICRTKRQTLLSGIGLYA
jgi:hypothetical protein